MGRPVFLAAAAAVVAAVVIVITAGVAAAAQAVIAAAAEQDEQDDDPAHITATETVVIHNDYLRYLFTAEPLIPWYSGGRFLCRG